jgi:hypothetical protein
LTKKSIDREKSYTNLYKNQLYAAIMSEMWEKIKMAFHEAIMELEAGAGDG